MITKQVRGDVLAGGHRHIAFGVNTEGYNSQGFAGIIAGHYWPALRNTGPKRLGEVMGHSVGPYLFHALVCHSLSPNGFRQTPTIITQCLDAISLPDGEEIACVLVGSGPVGLALGADIPAILEGIRRSRQQVAVYSL